MHGGDACVSLSTFFDWDAALEKDLGKDNALGYERGLLSRGDGI